MKRFTQSLFCITLLSLAAMIRADDCCDGTSTSTVASPVRSLVLPRSQGSNTTRELVGWQDFIHLCDVCETYGALDVEFEYTRSFRGARIARQLFGDFGVTSTGATVTTNNCDSGCSSSDDNFALRFQGSNVKANSARAISNSLLADNFGLSQDFDGNLFLSPRIDNFIVDFNFYLGLDCWVPGLYFRSHLPITHTRWSLFDNNGDCNTAVSGVESKNTGSEDTAFPTCYMADTTVTPATSIITALSGDFTFGEMQQKWNFGKFTTQRLDKTRLADIDLILGYDFYCTDCSHFGAYMQAVAPTGNSPESIYIFEPIVGNGHHWGLGGGISAHSTLWETDCDQNLSIWFEGNAIHLFKDTQTRSFDFKDQGALSRYMLLKEFDSAGDYTGNLINAINFATRKVESSFNVEGDASVKFAYRNCGFMADIGYNIWGRSAEKISLCQTDTALDNKYGFKGCQNVSYNTVSAATTAGVTSIAGTPTITPTPLDNTASNATITSCGTLDTPAPTINTFPFADGTGQTVALTCDSVTTTGAQVFPVINNGVVLQTETTTPVTLTSANLNLNGVRSALTNKVFGFVGYTWYDCDFTPFVGVHGEVEFASRRNNDNCGTASTTTTSTNRCNESAINQWGIGIKGGMSF